MQTKTPTRTATVRITTVTATPTGQLQQRTTPTPTRTVTPDNSCCDNGGTTPEVPTAVATETPTGPTPALVPVTGGTADASMSALGMIMLLGLGLLGVGWALKRAVK